MLFSLICIVLCALIIHVLCDGLTLTVDDVIVVCARDVTVVRLTRKLIPEIIASIMSCITLIQYF